MRQTRWTSWWGGGWLVACALTAAGCEIVSSHDEVESALMEGIAEVNDGVAVLARDATVEDRDPTKSSPGSEEVHLRASVVFDRYVRPDNKAGVVGDNAGHHFRCTERGLWLLERAEEAPGKWGRWSAQRVGGPLSESCEDQGLVSVEEWKEHARTVPRDRWR